MERDEEKERDAITGNWGNEENDGWSRGKGNGGMGIIYYKERREGKEATEKTRQS